MKSEFDYANYSAFKGSSPAAASRLKAWARSIGLGNRYVGFVAGIDRDARVIRSVAARAIS